MSHFNNKSIETQIKATNHQQYIEKDNLHSVSGCKYAFGNDMCTSGSKRGDYCESDNPITCPYNK
jgi:hypothetical protein